MKIGNEERDQVKALTDGKLGLAVKVQLPLSFKESTEVLRCKFEGRQALFVPLFTE